MYEYNTIRNAAKCRKCGSIIESKHIYDFVPCTCGAIFVDGGLSYTHAGGEPSDFEPLGVSVWKSDTLVVYLYGCGNRRSNAETVVQMLLSDGYSAETVPRFGCGPEHMLRHQQYLAVTHESRDLDVLLDPCPPAEEQAMNEWERLSSYRLREAIGAEKILLPVSELEEAASVIAGGYATIENTDALYNKLRICTKIKSSLETHLDYTAYLICPELTTLFLYRS